MLNMNPITYALAAVGIMIASVVYLTFVMVASVVTQKYTAMHAIVITAGIVYLFQICQLNFPYHAVTKILLLLTIAFGAASGLLLLV